MSNDGVYILYWARLSTHDDPWSQGYIGVSMNTLTERKTSHYKTAKSNKKRNVHFHNALTKYNDEVIWSTLRNNLTKDEAFALEEKYRPEIEIGWNTDKGGVEAVSPEWYENTKNKERHRKRTSEATKKKIKEKDTPEARSERAKKVWSNPEYKKSREGEIAGKNNPGYGLFGKDHPAAGHKKTRAGLEAISKAHKGKKLTESQKKAISDARSKSIGVFSEDRQRMYERRMAGETVLKIAEDYPISINAVDQNIRNWWKENNLEKPSKIKSEPNKKIPDEIKIKICERRNQGDSTTRISKSFNLATSSISNICNNWGPKNGFPKTKKQ